MDEPGAHALLDLGPENEEQLARLRRALILGAGFQIVFLEVSHPSLTKEILRRLRAWSGHDGVPPLAIVKTRPGRDPVAPLQHISAGAVLVGIDRSLDAAGIGRELVTLDDSGPEARGDVPAEALVEQTMTTLNWYRDQLPALVKGPLVLVLSPDGLRQLFVHAPDLLAWRSHTTRITLPRPLDLELRPRPSRRASLEEKAWLEKMIASSAANDRGPFVRELPGWLIRLGEIEAREGGPWQQHFARAEELAAGRRDIMVKVELARARHALDEERIEDAGKHIHRTLAQTATRSGDTEHDLESMLETTGWGDAARDVWTKAAVNEITVVLAEHVLHTGDVEVAANMAESALLGARAFGDLALVIAALGVAGAVASYRGDATAASARFSEMRKLAHDAQDRAAELFALTRLLELAPDVASARRRYRQAISMLDDEDHEARARICIELSRFELLENPDVVERLFSQLDMAALKPRTRFRILVARGAVAMAQGNLEAVLMAYRSAWDDPQRALLPLRDQVLIDVLLGWAALEVGELAIARDAFQRTAELGKSLASPALAALARDGLERVGIAPEGAGEPA